MGFYNMQLALNYSFKKKSNIAIIQNGVNYTYDQVNLMADRVAKKLIKLGAQKGDHVGVMCEDRFQTIVATLATFKLGGVFVPIDYSVAPNRIKELCEIGKVDVVVIDNMLEEDLKKHFDSKVTPYFMINKGFLNEADSNDEHEFVINLLGESDPVYIYFTSGTLGAPKAVLGKNESLMHFINWQIEEFSLDESIRISQITSPVHDPFLRDVFTALVAGGTVCLPESNQTILSPFELKQWLNESNINLVHITPTVFKNLCNSGLVSDDFANLKYVFLAGEKLIGNSLSKWYETFDDKIQLINLYGPTETTLAKFFYRINKEDTDKFSVPIGKPIPDTKVHVLDAEMNDTEEGELFIHTPFSSLGYFSDRELTNEYFLPDPSNVKRCEKYYRTGDFVLKLPDGNLEFLSRKDRQIKILGKRVELSEIEHRLMKHANVEACVVKHFEDDNNNIKDYLVAYYISNVDLAKETLISYLEKSTPEYMIPKHFLRIEALPVNANGKIEYGDLEHPVVDEIFTGKILEGSEDNLESKLICIWKEILDIDSVDPDDIFMLVGGDSRSIMLLIARIHSEFDVEISLWDVFDDLTVKKLVGLIEAA